MGKLHNNSGGEVKVRDHGKKTIGKDEEQVFLTYWRGKNPIISKAKRKDIILKNRFDFAKDAPKRYKNFAWLRKDRKPKDYFGVGGGKKYE